MLLGSTLQGWDFSEYKFIKTSVLINQSICLRKQERHKPITFISAAFVVCLGNGIFRKSQTQF